MWREFTNYFSFTKKDLRGIYVLFSLLAVVLMIRWIAPVFVSDIEPDFSDYERMVLALEKAGRINQKANASLSEEAKPEFIRPDREIAAIRLKPFPFDPNAMSEAEWLKLGLSIRQVRNIQNYLSRGGQFRKKEDFGRIYSISEEEYEILMPYITIRDSIKSASTVREFRKFDPDVEVSVHKKPEILIDINKADSIELLQVRGIGPAFASRILKYRNLLGGYHTAGQLLEVYGMDSTRFAQIEGRFIFDPVSVRQFDVNAAELKELTAHPYIDFYLAKSIIDQRIKKGKLASDADLYDIPFMHDALYRKLIPYFKFN